MVIYQAAFPTKEHYLNYNPGDWFQNAVIQNTSFDPSNLQAKEEKKYYPVSEEKQRLNEIPTKINSFNLEGLILLKYLNF